MDLVNLVEGLIAFIILLLGWNVRTLFNRVEKLDTKIDNSSKEFRLDMKDAYAKHELSTDALRTEMNQLGSSLRDAINDSSKGTNSLLVQILKNNS